MHAPPTTSLGRNPCRISVLISLAPIAGTRPTVPSPPPGWRPLPCPKRAVAGRVRLPAAAGAPGQQRGRVQPARAPALDEPARRRFEVVVQPAARVQPVPVVLQCDVAV